MIEPTRVLVLGSAGFIGSAITQQLLATGARVFALGRSETTSEDDRIVRVRGSIENGGLLAEAMAECAQIVYCAGLTTPGTSANDPALEVLGNLLPLARVLECSSRFPRRHLVYLSSGGTVFGDFARDADEMTPLRPRSYYGAGKAAAEALIHACTSTSDWRATVLRPTNPYGPGQEIAKAFAIVPTLFERALDGKAFQIWGDGSAVRDYCYIDDLVSATLTALSSETDSRFKVYNVASGEAISVADLIRACERASHRTIRIEYSPSRGVDVAHVSPSSRAIAEDLGWRPQTPLTEGLARTWSWIARGERGPSTSVPNGAGLQ